MMRTLRQARVQRDLHSGDKDAATDGAAAATPVLDHMARKGLIHKNKAARYKSRLNTRIRAL